MTFPDAQPLHTPTFMHLWYLFLLHAPARPHLVMVTRLDGPTRMVVEIETNDGAAVLGLDITLDLRPPGDWLVTAITPRWRASAADPVDGVALARAVHELAGRYDSAFGMEDE